jgi:hypothetical protein
VVGQLARGDELTVVGRNADGDWLRVGPLDSTSRWVSVSLLDVNLDLDEVTLFRSPPRPVPEQADQARALAEPILDAIADRPPDYQDDFSNPGSGWGQGAIVDPSGWEEGRVGYADGEYYVRAAQAKRRPQSTAPVTCASAVNPPAPAFRDMVLEVDGRFMQIQEGDWQLTIDRHPELERNLSMRFRAERGAWMVSVADGQETDLAEWQGFPIRGGLESNRLQIVVVGPQVALYANGEPALFGVDPYFAESYATGQSGLSVCNFADTPLEARWDNLRIWDISDLSSE